jgi:hypothetical protein
MPAFLAESVVLVLVRVHHVLWSLCLLLRLIRLFIPSMVGLLLARFLLHLLLFILDCLGLRPLLLFHLVVLLSFPLPLFLLVPVVLFAFSFPTSPASFFFRRFAVCSAACFVSAYFHFSLLFSLVRLPLIPDVAVLLDFLVVLPVIPPGLCLLFLILMLLLPYQLGHLAVQEHFLPLLLVFLVSSFVRQWLLLPVLHRLPSLSAAFPGSIFWSL